MKQAELRKLVEELIAEEREILATKNEEYTVGQAEDSDALFNFKEVADLLGIDPLEVFAVYWLKHVYAIINYVKAGKTFSDESIRNRILDGRLYLAFGCALMMEKAAQELHDEWNVQKGEELVRLEKENGDV